MEDGRNFYCGASGFAFMARILMNMDNFAVNICSINIQVLNGYCAH
jgi:hypothetical protein